MYFSKVYYDENGKSSEVEIICNKCGKYLNITEVNKFQTITNDYCIAKEKISCNCGNQYIGEIKYKTNPNLNDVKVKTYSTPANKPKCITCGSTNIRKMGTVERGASIVTFGVFSKKINKTFKCNNCGMTW